MFRKGSLAKTMLKRIKRSKTSAFVLRDFFDLSDRDQVIRVLRRLVRIGVLIKLGYGVYARATKTERSNQLVTEKYFPEVAKEALRKLKIRIYPSTYDKLYQAGGLQVPTGFVLGVRQRVSRNLSYYGRSIKYERVSPPN
jgi:hypothetical protein